MKLNLKKFNNASIKIASLVDFSLFILFVLFFIYYGYNERNKAEQEIKEKAINAASATRLNTQTYLNKAVTTAENLSATMANGINTTTSFTIEPKGIIALQEHVLANNSAFLSVASAWENNIFTNPDTLPDNHTAYDALGRFIPFSFVNDNNLIETKKISHFNSGKKNWYRLAARKRKAHISEPFVQEINGTEHKIIAVVSPVFADNYFLGVVRIDLPLQALQEIAQNHFVFEKNAELAVYTENGFITAQASRPALLSLNLFEQDAESKKKIDLLKKQSDNLIIEDNQMDIGIPFRLNSGDRWLVHLSVNSGFVKQQKNKALLQLWDEILFFMLLALLIVSVVMLQVNRLLKPLKSISKAADNMAKGKFSYAEIDSKTNEIKQVNTAFKKIFDSLKEKTQIVDAVRKGNYDKKVKVENEEDTLGIAINEMVNELKTAQNKQKIREQEDKVRAWISHGIAHFSELLRQNNNDLTGLSKKIIQELINYLDASIGGVFIINDEDEKDPFLELTAAFAYDRFRKKNKRIELDEGLLGRVVSEKKSIYMTCLPDNYMHIKSGLGEDKPKALLIVPLILNEEMYGAIELAAMHEFGKNKIEFAERVAQSITSAISAVKINSRTARLLEESQYQQQKLSEQEEEMRQNLEELQTTQEEMSRKKDEIEEKVFFYEQILDAIPLPISVTDIHKKWTFINTGFEKWTHTSRNEIHGKTCFIPDADICKNQYCSVKLLNNGKKVNSLSYKGKEFKIQTAFLYNQDKAKSGHIEIFQDITYEKQTNQKINRLLEEAENKTRELSRNEHTLRENLTKLKKAQDEAENNKAEIEGIFKAIRAAALMAQFDMKGNILNMNNEFVKLLGQEKQEMLQKNHKDYHSLASYPNKYGDFWNQLAAGQIVKLDSYIQAGTRQIWLHEVYSPIFDSRGFPVKIMNIAVDISELKQKEIQLTEQSEQLQVQEQEMLFNLEELNQAKEEAQKKENEMKAVLNAINSTALVAEFDMQGKILSINQQFLDLFNLQSKEILGKNHADFNTLAKNKKEYQKFWHDMQKGVSRKLDAHIKLPDGREVFLHEVYSTVFNHKNEPVRVINIATDISFAKKQELELKKAKQQLKELKNKLK